MRAALTFILLSVLTVAALTLHTGYDAPDLPEVSIIVERRVTVDGEPQHYIFNFTFAADQNDTNGIVVYRVAADWRTNTCLVITTTNAPE